MSIVEASQVSTGGPMKNILSSLAALTIVVTASTPAFSMNCVAYARQVTGMNLSGDAWHWWDSASGVYARGHQPAPGAVMVFARTRHMIHGHVAVVREVVDSRQILIDQANWLTGRMRGAVTEAVAARDVSPANDWSAVEIQWAHSSDFGRVNPIRGFVYGSNGDHGSRASLQDAVVREPDGQNSGFQNASISSYGDHAYRHHVVFRHAPVRMHCARPAPRNTRLARMAAQHRTAAHHNAHLTTVAAKHVPAAKPVTKPAVTVASHAAAGQQVAPVKTASATTVHPQPVIATASQMAVQRASVQSVKPSASQKPVIQQAAAPGIHASAAPARVASAAKVASATAHTNHRTVQKIAALQKSAKKKGAVQSAAVHVTPHNTSARQTN